jgi:alpha-mannosidase
LVTHSRGDIKFFAICFAKLFHEVKDIVDRIGSDPNLTSQELKKWFDKKMKKVEEQVAPVKGNLLEQQMDKFGEFNKVKGSIL